MPTSAPKPCTICQRLVSDGSSRCEVHKPVGKFADKRRGSRQSRGYGAEWERKRKVILQRDAGLCQPCRQVGRVSLAFAVDHIVNKESGGTDDDRNLQSICKDCHKVKTAREGRSARGGWSKG